MPFFNFTQRSSGKGIGNRVGSLNNAAFNLHDLFLKVVPQFRRRALEKQIGLDWTFAPDAPVWVFGDAGRLRQIITNLLTNAFKFTEAGFIYVEIFVDSVKDGLVMLHIVVADSGMGIPEDRTTDIFRLFEQIDSSATRKFGGVGLGLAICSRLVELMEGRIWVESQPGFGSEFRPGSYVMLRSQANGQAECTCIPISQLPLPDRVPFEVQRRPGRREWPESCRVADSDRTRLSHHSQDQFVERNGRG